MTGRLMRPARKEYDAWYSGTHIPLVILVGRAHTDCCELAEKRPRLAPWAFDFARYFLDEPRSM